MKALAIVAIAAVAGIAAAQQPLPRLQAFRFVVRHADPFAIKAMLEGQQIMTPEISTLLLLGGVPPAAAQAAQGANALFTGGRIIVHPGDNSLWFIPDRPGA
jgi:hypothetical protein